jgi:hypothetical protein
MEISVISNPLPLKIDTGGFASLFLRLRKIQPQAPISVVTTTMLMYYPNMRPWEKAFQQKDVIHQGHILLLCIKIQLSSGYILFFTRTLETPCLFDARLR